MEVLWVHEHSMMWQTLSRLQIEEPHSVTRSRPLGTDTGHSCSSPGSILQRDLRSLFSAG